jgi:hypothetical protein
VQKADIPLTPLNLANVRSIDPGGVGESFLRDVSLNPLGPQRGA